MPTLMALPTNIAMITADMKGTTYCSAPVSSNLHQGIRGEATTTRQAWVGEIDQIQCRKLPKVRKTTRVYSSPFVPPGHMITTREMVTRHTPARVAAAPTMA